MDCEVIEIHETWSIIYRSMLNAKTYPTNLHEMFSSVPPRRSIGDGELAGHNLLHCGMDIGEVVECCEGDVLSLAVRNEIWS